MKKEKMSLKSVKNVLSRAEMKKIMAGSGNQCLNDGQECDVYGDGGSCCPGLYCATDVLGVGVCSII